MIDQSDQSDQIEILFDDWKWTPVRGTVWSDQEGEAWSRLRKQLSDRAYWHMNNNHSTFVRLGQRSVLPHIILQETLREDIAYKARASHEKARASHE